MIATGRCSGSIIVEATRERGEEEEEKVVVEEADEAENVRGRADDLGRGGVTEQALGRPLAMTGKHNRPMMQQLLVLQLLLQQQQLW
eukprot:CAMPEP_0170183246 /NCGR_PEP_ID=MMETSP0040_2-20121228/30093_1 /TAXON_ID=641309 /ORGANISM="Lotharella oceanica, Strain CCMP622" /LENGTH=86 /DNA_ID=CAMNT_0010428923 /DNA_START=527 /DNA_END=784 /DNA_ORIENTATION=-